MYVVPTFSANGSVSVNIALYCAFSFMSCESLINMTTEIILVAHAMCCTSFISGVLAPT